MKSLKLYVMVILLVIGLIIPTQLVKGQTNNFAKVDSITKIINTAVKNVSDFIYCYDTLVLQEYNEVCIMVYLHNSLETDNMVFSVSDFPFAKKAIEQLSILGYYYYYNNLVFIAVDKGLEFQYPKLIRKDIDHIVDSVIDRYNYQLGSAVYFYYYYLFKFKKIDLDLKIISLDYSFYRDFSEIPIKDRGLENDIDYVRNNVRYTKLEENTIFQECDNYKNLTNYQRSSLLSGKIEIIF